MATQSQGTCTFCDSDSAKGGMVRHLRACSEREAAIQAADGDNTSETLYHLRAEDEWGRPFWLDLEMRGSVSLEELDRYLRAIWLECCGHLSQFSVGGWGGSEIPKSRRVGQVFDEDTELTHIYDFGTESRTQMRTMDMREGAPTTKHPLALMARNNKPEAVCMECDREASGTLCDEHVEEHPHDAYGAPMPILNSPCTGMCGYTGPAEPPYSVRTAFPSVFIPRGMNRFGVTPGGRVWTGRWWHDVSSAWPRRGRPETLRASPWRGHPESSGREGPRRDCDTDDACELPLKGTGACRSWRRTDLVGEERESRDLGDVFRANRFVDSVKQQIVCQGDFRDRSSAEEWHPVLRSGRPSAVEGAPLNAFPESPPVVWPTCVAPTETILSRLGHEGASTYSPEAVR